MNSTPAPLNRRFLAGLIDGGLLLIICVIAFLGPLLLKGLVLPMWGVLLAILGLNVIPLAFQKQTLGFRLMKLQLVTADGHAVDLGNVLFRELIGRGLFPLAYVYTVLAGLLARALGIIQFAAPVGVAALFFLISSVAVVLAVVGHFYALSTREGRTFADLMARSFVIQQPVGDALPEDAEDRAEALQQRSRITRNVIIFQLFTLIAIGALPWLLTIRFGESSEVRIARIKRENLQKKFEHDPANRALAQDLRDELNRVGLREEADAVIKKFGEAQSAKEAARETQLRKTLSERPQDRQTFTALLELLEEQSRYQEASVAYLQFLGPDITPAQRGGYAHWLASVDLEADAEAQFRQALADDPLISMGHTMFGILLIRRKEKLPEAQEELFLALLDDPTDEDANESLGEVTGQLGPLSEEKQKVLRARYDAWSKAAEAKTRAEQQPQQ